MEHYDKLLEMERKPDTWALRADNGWSHQSSTQEKPCVTYILWKEIQEVENEKKLIV